MVAETLRKLSKLENEVEELINESSKQDEIQKEVETMKRVTEQTALVSIQLLEAWGKSSHPINKEISKEIIL